MALDLMQLANSEVEVEALQHVRVVPTSVIEDKLLAEAYHRGCRIDSQDLVLGRANFDPLQWWYNRRHTTPELAKFAFDTLALPMMSDNPEGSFTSGRDMITYRRSNPLDNIVQACMCLRSWYGTPSAKKKAGIWLLEEFDNEDDVVASYQAAQQLAEVGSEDKPDGEDLQELDQLLEGDNKAL